MEPYSSDDIKRKRRKKHFKKTPEEFPVDSSKFRSDECYVIVSEKEKIIYIWKGLRCNVRKRFIASRIAMNIHGQMGLPYTLTQITEGEEDPEFIKIVSDLKEKPADYYKDDGNDYFPYPYIFKPPGPPDDLEMATQHQVKKAMDKVPENEIFCQYCGMKLIKEERFSHNCRKNPE